MPRKHSACGGLDTVADPGQAIMNMSQHNRIQRYHNSLMRVMSWAATSVCVRRLVHPLHVAIRVAALLLGFLASSGPDPKPSLVLWAWERPEDLRFADGVDVAVLAGTVVLSGADAVAHPRLQPARLAVGQRAVGTVHVEIDRGRKLRWSPGLRAEAAAAVLSTLRSGFTEVQIDFEVRASEHAVLLDLLRDVRAGLPPGTWLSMTALASWCDTERWLSAAPVDEVVPMLFRMGPGGEALRQRLASGGDFGDARCHRSLGVATDTVPVRLPPGRRIFLFNPRPWTVEDLAVMRRRLA